MKQSSNSGIIRLIAIFKLLKAITLLAVGWAALRLIHTDAATQLDHWVARFGLEAGGRYVDLAAGKLASVPPERFKDVGLGSFVYAALFFVEGIGLWLRKRWAEWFTSIITASLVPLELYELHRHPTATKAIVLIINIAVVVYLLVRIRRRAISN